MNPTDQAMTGAKRPMQRAADSDDLVWGKMKKRRIRRVRAGSRDAFRGGFAKVTASLPAPDEVRQFFAAGRVLKRIGLTRKQVAELSRAAGC